VPIDPAGETWIFRLDSVRLENEKNRTFAKIPTCVPKFHYGQAGRKFDISEKYHLVFLFAANNLDSSI